MPTAQQLIDRLQLKPHPEGGFYRELFRSEKKVTRHSDQAERSALTTIYFLMPEGVTSAMHLVLSDEVWHHLEGAPLDVIVCDDDFVNMETHSIGSVLNQMEAEYVVPAGYWQAARSTGAWTLVSCVVGPGFDFLDFTMLRDNAEKVAMFEKAFPNVNSLI